MIIGIDFDNTIIDYEQLFYQAMKQLGWEKYGIEKKTAIKKQLIEEDGNDLRWQFIQKIVYSELIAEATAFKGVKNFVKNRVNNGDTIYVISHKTSVSNLDGKTNLIEPALNWLEYNQFIGVDGLLEREAVFFCETRDEKIRTINNLNCDIFIDDLLVVLEHKMFNERTLKVLWGQTEKHHDIISINSWRNFEPIVFMRRHLKNSIINELIYKLKRLPVSVEECDEGGNHNAYILTMPDNEMLFLKLTSEVYIDRLEREYRALELLNQAGFNNVPTSCEFSYKHGFLIEEYIDGEKIAIVRNEHFRSIENFILQLKSVTAEFPKSSEFRFSLSDYTLGIERRLEKIENGISKLKEKYPELLLIQSLLDQFFYPLKNEIFKHFRGSIKHLELDEKQIFPLEDRILNPSDFGFHNILSDPNGKIYFIDFEYFGWDDTAKMVCDFIHHFGHTLSLRQKLTFLSVLRENGIINDSIKQRVEIVMDIIGLEWILIVLNIAQEDKLQQKKQAYSKIDAEMLIRNQYKKAKSRLETYINSLKDKKEIITLGINRADLWTLN